MDPLDRCFAAVAPLVDVDRIADQIARLAERERRTDFDSFEGSARYLAARFRDLGAACEVLRFPADGVTTYGCWTAPIGYRTTRAKCAIVAPAQCACVLGDRDVEPNTAIVGTGYTGPGGIEAPVVHVAAREDLPGLDIAGKIVFCDTLHPASIRRAVLDGGGAAVVSSWARDRQHNRAYVQWINTWDAEPDGWLPTAQARTENLPGISLSSERGDVLRACLAQGPVVLRIVTEGAYYPSQLPGVWALSPGADDALVLLTGHLFEQGLIDNASGVGVALAVHEIVRRLQETAGLTLRRGLANYHSQECYGVLALAAYGPERVRRACAHLNLDQVGRGGLPVRLRPGLLASTGFSGALLRMALARAQQLVPACGYEIGDTFEINCTLLADPLLGGVPTSLLEQDNPEWHTSHDRAGAQQLDADVLRMVTLAVAAWATLLVSAGDREVEWLRDVYREEVERAVAAGEVADGAIYAQLVEREMSSLAAIASPGARASLRREAARLARAVSRQCGARAIVPEGTADEVAASRRCYPRALVGGTAVARCFTEAQLRAIGAPKWSTLQLVLKSWADGSRSAYDIARLASTETGKALTLSYVLTFFQVYADAGLVSLEREPLSSGGCR